MPGQLHAKLFLFWEIGLDEFDIVVHGCHKKIACFFSTPSWHRYLGAHFREPRMCKEQLFLDCLVIRCRGRNDAVLFRPLNHKIE